MITSIVGRLIKKPEVAERIQIPGKHVVNFTVVENRSRGEKRLSVFFNLSLIIGTDAQFDLALRLDKGTVLLFSAPRITYVRQSEKSDTEQTINLYADADNFKIVAGTGVGEGGAAARGSTSNGGGDGGDMFAAAPAAAAPAPVDRGVPSAARRATNLSDPDDADDPFAEYEPAPPRSRAIPAARAAPSTARPAPGRSAQSAPAPRPGASGPSGSGARGSGAPPSSDEDDMADLSDPFADSSL